MDLEGYPAMAVNLLSVLNSAHCPEGSNCNETEGAIKCDNYFYCDCCINALLLQPNCESHLNQMWMEVRVLDIIMGGKTCIRNGGRRTSPSPRC